MRARTTHTRARVFDIVMHFAATYNVLFQNVKTAFRFWRWNKSAEVLISSQRRIISYFVRPVDYDFIVTLKKFFMVMEQ